ncbi:hypothetical protein [Metabacillus fastidiosus]|uniref:hypothetical protein n=1 Tax=Metabacillus fastidiosus TaxID=1458 RepID=UPI003D2D8819
MLAILREYVENGEQVTEYTRDGKTVSHTVRVLQTAQIPPEEVLPVPPTFEQRIAELQAKNAELEAALVEMTELAAQQEQRSTQNEQAIVELTMLVGGQA